jgi:hypothetical protein
MKQTYSYSQLLQPIAKALNRLSDAANIADACEDWLVLWKRNQPKPYLTTVTTKFEEVATEYHYLADQLHSEHIGKNLPAQAAESAFQLLIFFNSQNSETIADLCAFTAGAESFPTTLVSAPCVDRLSSITQCISMINFMCGDQLTWH